MDHRGRVALVTGGSRGIGEAIAHRLAEEGLKVAVVGRDREALGRVAFAIGGRAVVADLEDRKALAAAVIEVHGSIGPIDVLVNNAGVADSASLDRTDDAIWDRALAVNVTAAFALCREVLPAMAKRGWGRVINVASNAGLRGYAYTSAYCASKHALVGLTRALAVEYARSGVTVNAVCPGFVDTEMARRAVTRISESTKRDASTALATLEAMSPQRRLMTPKEVAHVVWSLIPHEARGVHGQAIALDGGQTA